MKTSMIAQSMQVTRMVENMLNAKKRRVELRRIRVDKELKECCFRRA
jgi:hypothetical protein